MSPKLPNIGLLSHGHVPKSENHANERGIRFSHNEAEKLLVQNETEQFYGAFELFFSRFTLKIPPKKKQQTNALRISLCFPRM